LIAAINAANSSGGARINLAPFCTYHLTTASSPNAMLGDTGLPAITSRITLNGFRTTIARNDSTFRILLVTGTGKLTLNGLTITGGTRPGRAAASSTWKARSSSTAAGSPATRRRDR
jgi:hypothetical protein